MQEGIYTLKRKIPARTAAFTVAPIIRKSGFPHRSGRFATIPCRLSLYQQCATSRGLSMRIPGPPPAFPFPLPPRPPSQEVKDRLHGGEIPPQALPVNRVITVVTAAGRSGLRALTWIGIVHDFRFARSLDDHPYTAWQCFRTLAGSDITGKGFVVYFPPRFSRISSASQGVRLKIITSSLNPARNPKKARSQVSRGRG